MTNLESLGNIYTTTKCVFPCFLRFWKDQFGSEKLICFGFLNRIQILHFQRGSEPELISQLTPWPHYIDTRTQSGVNGFFSPVRLGCVGRGWWTCTRDHHPSGNCSLVPSNWTVCLIPTFLFSTSPPSSHLTNTFPNVESHFKYVYTESTFVRGKKKK